MKLFKMFTSRKKKEEQLKEQIHEALEFLLGVGITPNHEDFEEWILCEWDQVRVEENICSMLLYSLGDERIADTLWVPVSDDVYTFDTECFEEDTTYTTVLERLSAISKGELALHNISSVVDHDKCVATLSFEHDGMKYEWNPVYQDDWFDVTVITKMNDILKNQNSKNFFYSSSDDQCMTIIFSSERVVFELNEKIAVPFERI